jgi:hypothetical protein
LTASATPEKSRDSYRRVTFSDEEAGFRDAAQEYARAGV